MKLKTEREMHKNIGPDIDILGQLPTPIYDAKGNDVKKYFALGGAKYIEELGEALRQDWTKDVSMAFWKNGAESNRIRLLMRRKLVDDWSHEKGNPTPWSDEFITLNLPEFLKYPAHLEHFRSDNMRENARIRMEKINQARAAKYKQKVQSELKTIGRIVSQSPEPPKEPKEEVEYPTSNWSLGPSKYHKLGTDTKTPLTKMGDIRDGCRELFTALTEKDRMPGLSEDLENDFIKPTREYRKFIYELDEHEQAGLYNWLECTQAAISDMLDILDEAKAKQA
jgi:hypothetical protein